jgi:aminoglycoside 3-N-acetyltransferase
MHTRTSLIEQLKSMGIDPQGTLLMHSSMKSIGEVEGGADTVLDALSDYMQDGLLVLPTHTWSYIRRDHPDFYVDQSPSCVGILTELFRQRPGVIRSWHPTHSVAALGQDAASFTAGDEKCDTPCHRQSVWGKLLDRKATIILVGVDLRRNTYIHGIEEWVDIPGRLTDHHEPLFTILAEGPRISVPSRRHCGQNWSEYFWKVDELLERTGAMSRGQLGDAEVRICDAVRTYDVLSYALKINPNLFSDDEPMDMGEQEAIIRGITSNPVLH